MLGINEPIAKRLARQSCKILTQKGRMHCLDAGWWRRVLFTGNYQPAILSTYCANVS